MDIGIPQFYPSCSYSDSLGKNIDLRNTSPMPLIKSPILYHILKSWRNAPPRTAYFQRPLNHAKGHRNS